jgi:hypothetical protein
MAEDTSDLGHAQPDLPVNNVNNSINTGDAYVDEVLSLVPEALTKSTIS